MMTTDSAHQRAYGREAEARREPRRNHERPEEGPGERRRDEQVADPVARRRRRPEPDQARDEVPTLARRHVARVPPEEEQRAEDADGLEVPVAGEPDRDRDDHVRRRRDGADGRAPPLFRDAVEQRRDGRAHEHRGQVDEEVVVAEEPVEDRGHVVLAERVMAHERRALGPDARVPGPRRVEDVPADHLLGRHQRARAARAQVTGRRDGEHAPDGREDEPRAGHGENPARDAVDQGPLSPRLPSRFSEIRPHPRSADATMAEPHDDTRFASGIQCRWTGGGPPPARLHTKPARRRSAALGPSHRSSPDATGHDVCPADERRELI